MRKAADDDRWIPELVPPGITTDTAAATAQAGLQLNVYERILLRGRCEPDCPACRLHWQPKYEAAREYHAGIYIAELTGDDTYRLTEHDYRHRLRQIDAAAARTQPEPR